MDVSRNGSSSGDDVLVVELSRGRRTVTILVAVVMLALFGGLAVILMVLNVPARNAVPMLLICLAMAALAAWQILDTGRRFLLSATHLVSRPLFGGASAIAWEDIVKVKRAGPYVVLFESRHGESIPIGSLFFRPELWSRVRESLRSNEKIALLDLPGMDAPTGRSRLSSTVQSLAVVSMGLAAALAPRVDWRDADLRCIEKSAVSLFDESLRCVDYATAAHDAAWLNELLASGADPNRANANGDRPLHMSIRNRFPDGVRALLEAGADPMGRNRRDRTAVQLALELQDDESVQAMLLHISAGGAREQALQVLEFAMEYGDAEFRTRVRQELGALLPRISDPLVEGEYRALLEQAEAARVARDYGRLIVLGEAAIELDPTVGVGYLLAGLGYGEQRNWGYAKRHLLKAVELMPANADAWAYLGNLYYLTGEYRQADAAYGKALGLRPDWWHWYADRGISRAEEGRHQAALEDLTKACDNGVATGCDLRREILGKLEE